MTPRCAFCGRDIEQRWGVPVTGGSIRSVDYCSIRCREELDRRRGEILPIVRDFSQWAALIVDQVRVIDAHARPHTISAAVDVVARTLAKIFPASLYDAPLKENTMDVPEIQMPLYQSHKKVRAAKIVSVDADAGRMQIDIAGYLGGVSIRHEWMAKHEPQPGGYLVMYDDGYLSYSPAEAFENGYTRIDEALDAHPRFGMKRVDDHQFLFTDVRGDVWELRRTDDPSMPLIITAYAKA